MALSPIIANNVLPLGALAPVGAPLGGAPSTIPASAGAYSLAFTMQPQQLSNWCWSAVSVSVAEFYNAASWPQQCDLVSQELGQTCCPAGTNPAACDVPWYLDRALQRVGHLNNWTNGSFPMAAIQPEINGNRPLAVRIGWNSGGGHFVVLSGFSSSPAGDFVTVEDPIYGQSTLLLSTFQTAYQGSGSWTHSYRTRP